MPGAAPGERGPRGGAPDPGPGFVADAMLGRLARWLRALGHDVVFDETLDDAGLARLARREGRLLLTRDRRLCETRGSPAWCLLIEAERPAAQLREVDRRRGVFGAGWRDRAFTRCMVCNTPLVPASFEAARERLPREVRADPRVRSAGFRRCPECERVYWEGSHTRRMRRWLEAATG